MSSIHSIQFVDSHTGGEPTRLVVAGGPELGVGPLSERVKIFAEKFDHFRRAIVGEPRGAEAMVGALLVPPHDPACKFGVIFFNNVGYLGMCGHGTIGLVVSLAHLGRVKPGAVRIDTPVGPIEAVLRPDGQVAFDNVPSYRRAKEHLIVVPSFGELRCDIAWGGNWFCLVEEHRQRLELSHLAALTDFCVRVRKSVNDAGFPEVDHVELFGPAQNAGAHGRSFVLCPGYAYDRSPCGTGTSAKLACLAADGKLAPGETWVQESFIGSVFHASYRRQGEKIIPTITGSAFVMAEGTQRVHSDDAFGWGIV